MMCGGWNSRSTRSRHSRRRQLRATRCTSAWNATTARDEVIGRSDGKPGQTFKLLNAPVLALDPQRDYLVVEPPLGEPEQIWTEVSDFADSGEYDRHFTLDSMTGELAFGPALLQ